MGRQGAGVEDELRQGLGGEEGVSLAEEDRLKAGAEEKTFRVKVSVPMKPAEVLTGREVLKAWTRRVASRVGNRLEDSKLFLPPSGLRLAKETPLGLGPVIGSREDLVMGEVTRESEKINVLRLLTLDLYHVLENAVDAIADRAEEESGFYPGRIEVVARREGEDLVLEVSDNGIGIPEVLKPWVFKERFTTKEEGTRAGGRGAAMLGMYGFRLLGKFGGRVELATLRYNPAGTAVENREQPWGLVYDPAKDRFSELARSPESRTEAGTTIRWRFPGVLRGEKPAALSSAVAAGMEDLQVQRFRNKPEGLRTRLEVPEGRELVVVTLPEAGWPALGHLYAHADLYDILFTRFPEGQLSLLMHPSVTAGEAEAKASSRRQLQKADQTSWVVLHDRYVLPEEAWEWVPTDTRRKIQVPLLVLSRETLKNLGERELAFLKAVSWFLREPVAAADFDFNAAYNGKPALAFYA